MRLSGCFSFTFENVRGHLSSQSVSYWVADLCCLLSQNPSDLFQNTVTMIPAHDSPLAALTFNASATKLASASERVSSAADVPPTHKQACCAIWVWFRQRPSDCLSYRAPSSECSPFPMARACSSFAEEWRGESLNISNKICIESLEDFSFSFLSMSPCTRSAWAAGYIGQWKIIRWSSFVSSDP